LGLCFVRPKMVGNLAGEAKEFVVPAPSYSFEQLQELHLPGYSEPIQFEPSEASPLGQLEASDWQIVLNTAIVCRFGGVYRTRTMVRTPESNPTHPNVISTATQRKAPDVLAAIIRDKRGFLDTETRAALPKQLAHEVDTRTALVIARFMPEAEPVGGIGVDSRRPLGRAVAELLVDKLGVDEGLLTRQLIGYVSLSALSLGFSNVEVDGAHGNPVVQTEPLALVRTILELPPRDGADDDFDPHEIFGETEHYAYPYWSPVRDFGDNVAGRKVQPFLPDAVREGDIFQFCQYGQCMIGAAESLGDEAQLAALARAVDPR
jgi:hypothetical protein